MERGIKLSTLITGATGFVGKKLLFLLEELGEEIIIISRKKHPNYNTIICDFNSENIPHNSLDSVNTVFHLAGFAHDFRNPSSVENIYHRINVEFTIQLAQLAARSEVKHFIFVSSVKAGGGLHFKKCLNESDVYEPEGVYGKSKRQAEIKLLEISNKSGMHISIVRPSLAYGPGVKGNLGKMQLAISRGFFPPLPETGNRRSMVHVDDLVRSLVFIASSDTSNGEIFIVTDGNDYSSRYIYEVMCKSLGKNIPSWYVPRFLFDFAAYLSPRIKYKIDKLLGDECYSSKKIQSIGFRAKKNLKDINETRF
jgi:UDP-glucose 4-epimerase